MIAAISSANTMAKPALEPTCRISSTGSSETMPKATAPEDSSTPSRLQQTRPDHGDVGRQRVGVDDGRDRVGGVVEAVDEFEAERDQQRDEKQDIGQVGRDPRAGGVDIDIDAVGDEQQRGCHHPQINDPRQRMKAACRGPALGAGQARLIRVTQRRSLKFSPSPRWAQFCADACDTRVKCDGRERAFPEGAGRRATWRCSGAVESPNRIADSRCAIRLWSGLAPGELSGARVFSGKCGNDFQVVDKALHIRAPWRPRRATAAGRTDVPSPAPATPSSRSISRPRFLLIGVILPNTHWAAVAPIATTSCGLIAASSRSYHCRHALISGVAGFWCRRIFPRGTNLKCFTALVT